MDKLLGLVDDQPVFVNPSGKIPELIKLRKMHRNFSDGDLPFHLLQNLGGKGGKLVVPRCSHRTFVRSFIIASVQSLETWQNVLVVRSPNAFSKTCVKEIDTYLQKCNGSIDEKTRNELGAIADSLR